MTLPNQVLNWLRANPSKCINADEIADYFSVSRAKVATQLAFAVREGELALDPLGGEDAEPVWYLPKSEWAIEHGHANGSVPQQKVQVPVFTDSAAPVPVPKKHRAAKEQPAIEPEPELTPFACALYNDGDLVMINAGAEGDVDITLPKVQARKLIAYLMSFDHTPSEPAPA